jgi:ABC-type multidrug transport system permease subunit
VRFVWSTLIKDWRRNRRNPVEYAIWIGIPLIIGALIIIAFGGRSGPKPQIPILVADEDGSFLSGLLVGSLSQDALGGLIQAEEVSQEEGRHRLEDGKVTALLIIPENFGEAFLREQPTKLTLLTNPSQRIMPGIVEETLSIMTDGGFYLQRLLGTDLRAMANGPPAGRNTFQDSFISDFSIRINHLVDRLHRYFDPLVMRLETESGGQASEGEEVASPNFATLFVAGIIFMSLLFMALGLSGDLWQEREQRTLRRVVISPRSVVGFMAGKFLAGAAIMLVVCLVALSVGYAYFRLNLLTLPLAVAWATCSGGMFLAGMTLLQVWAQSQRAGNIISTTVVFPLIMLGGSFFPFEAMPDWMANIGRLTPNGWALQYFKAILAQNIHLGKIGLGFLGLFLITGLLFLLAARRVRKGFAQG